MYTFQRIFEGLNSYHCLFVLYMLRVGGKLDKQPPIVDALAGHRDTVAVETFGIFSPYRQTGMTSYYLQ